LNQRILGWKKAEFRGPKGQPVKAEGTIGSLHACGAINTRALKRATEKAPLHTRDAAVIVPAVSQRQIQLFPNARPLLDRLGPEPFKNAPPAPGVYVMADRRGRVIYVGQSSNLRARLGSYRNARQDRVSAKVLRLVKQVETITWETCKTAAAARLRENELLRLFRPKFNRANTFPGAYTYLWLAYQEESGRLLLGRTQSRPTNGEVFGAFKGSGLGYAALLRTLWQALYPGAGLADFPALLLQGQPPRVYVFNLGCAKTLVGPAQVVQELREFLSGTSDQFLRRLEQAKTQQESACPILNALRTIDSEALAAFYLAGPVRNVRLSSYRAIVLIPRRIWTISSSSLRIDRQERCRRGEAAPNNAVRISDVRYQKHLDPS
jgi:predicted GIY-YIG superfamily endonuclease